MPPVWIVLVDDDTEFGALLKRKLEQSGRFQVEYVAEAPAAQARARKLAKTLAQDSPPQRIGAFVLDIDMPGLSGGELAAELGEDPLLAGVPILFLSSMVTPQEAAHSKGRHPVLSKGGTMASLLQAMEQALKKAEGGCHGGNPL